MFLKHFDYFRYHSNHNFHATAKMTCIDSTIQPIHIPSFIKRAPRSFGVLVRMAIYFQGAGSIGNYLQGFGEQAHSFGDLGSPAKKF